MNETTTPQDTLLKGFLLKIVFPAIVWSVSAAGFVTYTSHEVTTRLDKLENGQLRIEKNLEKLTKDK
jgi:hypothetical protein